jgi:hypothetical protein
VSVDPAGSTRQHSAETDSAPLGEKGRRRSGKA